MRVEQGEKFYDDNISLQQTSVTPRRCGRSKPVEHTTQTAVLACFYRLLVHPRIFIFVSDAFFFFFLGRDGYTTTAVFLKKNK